MGSKSDPATEVVEIVEWLRVYAAERINSATIDERRCFPPHLILDFGNRGILGMVVDPRYGGLGFGQTQAARVLEQLGAIDSTICLFVGLNNYLGITPIANHAAPAAKDELLPKLAAGRQLAAFALTEPGAGSNPRAMESRAENIGTDRWRLYGTKYWIGAAQWAGVLNVFAREGATHAIGAHLVRQGSPGLRQGPEAPTMGMRGLIQNAVLLNGVAVSRRDRLGQEGQGMAIAQEAMMHARLGIGALCIGAMQRCAQLALRYVSRRQISTGRLLANPSTLAKLSRITAAVTALGSLVYRLAAASDAGDEVPIEGFTVCKIAAPELLWSAADDLMQLAGGRGYMENSPIPQIMRDARVLRIFEGPTETMEAFLGARLMGSSSSLRRLIEETLGAPHLLPRLSQVAQAIEMQSQRSPARLGAGIVHWGQVRAGRLAVWLILQASLEGGRQGELPAETRRAADWAKAHLEQELLLLKHGTPIDMALLDAADVSDVIDGFGDRIGDVSQALPLMDSALDPLLCPRPVASPASPAQPELAFIPEPAPPRRPALPATRAPTNERANDQRAPLNVANAKVWLVSWLSQRMRVSPADVRLSGSFADQGIDSMMALELTQALSEELGITLDETLLWELPTIEALLERLPQLAREAAPRAASTAHAPLVEQSPRLAGERLDRKDVDRNDLDLNDEVKKLEAELALHKRG